MAMLLVYLSVQLIDMKHGRWLLIWKMFYLGSNLGNTKFLKPHAVDALIDLSIFVLYIFNWKSIFNRKSTNTRWNVSSPFLLFDPIGNEGGLIYPVIGMIVETKKRLLGWGNAHRSNVSAWSANTWDLPKKWQMVDFGTKLPILSSFMVSLTLAHWLLSTQKKLLTQLCTRSGIWRMVLQYVLKHGERDLSW